MEDISLHILDIAENSIRAGASLVEIEVIELPSQNRLEVIVRDNGRGMTEEEQQKALDPFYTSKDERKKRIGLGLPLLRQSAQEAGGELEISSEPNKGTVVKATFEYNHIDRRPLGDLAATIMTLVIGNPTVDFIFKNRYENMSFEFDSREAKQELEPLPLWHPEVARELEKLIRDRLAELRRIGGG